MMIPFQKRFSLFIPFSRRWWTKIWGILSIIIINLVPQKNIPFHFSEMASALSARLSQEREAHFLSKLSGVTEHAGIGSFRWHKKIYFLPFHFVKDCPCLLLLRAEPKKKKATCEGQTLWSLPADTATLSFKESVKSIPFHRRLRCVCGLAVTTPTTS